MFSKALRFIAGLAFFIFGLQAWSQNCDPPPAGLVSWWAAEGNAMDTFGLDNGTLVGNLGFTAGEDGQAFDFVGTNGYVTIPPSGSLDVGQGQGLTIETWINPTDGLTLRPLVEWNSGSAYGVHFWINQPTPFGTGPGSLYANLVDTNGQGHSVASPPGYVVSNVFQHVALTYDRASGVATFYYDGTQVGQQNIGSFALQTSYPLYFGYRPWGDAAGTVFAGAMDEVGLYNRALTAGEIQAIYNAGSAGKCKEPAIWMQPQSQMVPAGSSVTFSVTAAGAVPLSYQWQFNGTNLASPNGTITTVAGGGVGGDGSLATNASLSSPRGVAVDAAGDLFIADQQHNTVRKVTKNTGLISTIAGNGTGLFSGDGGQATGAGLQFPYDVAVDASGNLYIADLFDQRIRKVATNGIITTVAGSGPTGPSGGGFSGDGGAATNARLNDPPCVAADAVGDLFIADFGNNRIRKVDTNGIITTVAGGGTSGLGDGGAATNASLSNPNTVTVDALGNIFIGDFSNNRVRKVNTSGIITTVAGGGTNGLGDGGAATNASLSNPTGVAVDTYGYLFISDTGNNRIREVTPGGIITTVAGDGNPGFSGDGGPATNATLSYPYNMTVDKSGDVFFADLNNNRIRSVTLNTAPTLTINDVNTNNAGDYTVIVSNTYGSVTSSVAVLTVNLPMCDPPPAGLVSWWAGEGNAADNFGLNNGTLVGGVAFTNGEVGEAFNLNGTSQYVDVPNSASLNPTASFSLEAWIYPRQYASASAPVIKKAGEGSGQQDGYSLEIDGSTGIVVSAYANGGVGWVEGVAAPVPLNQWSYVVGVYNGTNLAIYVNGVLVGTPVPVTGSLIPSGNDLQIGHDPANPSRYFNGLIDEASIYNTALSASQIQAIYMAGSAGKCSSFSPVITGNPQSETIYAGRTARFSGEASGSQPLSYQWLENSTNIPASANPTATNATLVLTNANVGQSGNIYSLIVTNAYGVTNSSSAVLTVLGPGSCFPPPAGLVSWWPGERTGIDIAGANNGTLVGGVTFATGEVGQAFDINGASQYVDVPNSPGLNPTAGITVEAWVYPTQLSGVEPIITKAGEGTAQQHGYSLDIIGTSGLLFGVYVNGTWMNDSYGPVALNQWSHVAGTYDGTNVSIYVNGQLVQTLFAPGSITSSGNDLQIGHDSSNPSRAMNGLIDEPTLYNTALSAIQIQDIYDAGTTGKCKEPVIAGQPQSQVGYWGSNVVLSVSAAGTAPLYYQWDLNDAPILGATNASLVLSDLQFTNAGAYTVVISNLYGSMTSAPANLTVNPAGVSLALYSGLTITGVPGLTYGIQYTTDLSDTNGWAGLANITLSQTNELWFDLQPATLQHRYYRVVPGPISIP